MAKDETKKKKESIMKDLETLGDKLILSKDNKQATLAITNIIKKLEHELKKLKGPK